jgi:hypothetical protein
MLIGTSTADIRTDSLIMRRGKIYDCYTRLGGSQTTCPLAGNII